jgi:FkbM family methyltransferase
MRNQVLQDLARREPDFEPDVIFDVGANVGQSATEFHHRFPSAHVFAFEPIPASYAKLLARTNGHARTQAFNIGLSRAAGELLMKSHGTSPGNRVLAPGERHDNRVETVPVVSGDDFCADHDITSIDFLKIDAEGHDPEVLVGFAGMLRERRIRYLQVEASFSPRNLRHAPFHQLAHFLYAFGYGVDGVFGLKRHTRTVGRTTAALFGDAVFVRDELLESSRGVRNRGKSQRRENGVISP